MKKYFLYFWAILKARILKKRVPIFVVICVTNRCNLRCAYCYEEVYDRQEGEFTKEAIFSLIDQLTDMGTRYVSINGGEALLRGDFKDIVDKVKSNGLLCHLSTNGTLVSKHLETLREVDSIAISIDGDQLSNDRNRGEGSYNKIIEGMKSLKQAGIKFHTHTVITKNNKGAIEEILDMAQQYNFQAQFSPLRIEDSLDKSLGLNDTEMKEVVERLLKYKKGGRPVFFSAKAYDNFLKWPYPYHQLTISKDVPAGYHPIRCNMKRFACHIEANGLVYPCIVLVNRFKALNFLDAGFKKAWDHLAENDCKACHNICCNDQNLIYDININSILNAVKIVRKRLKKE